MKTLLTRNAGRRALMFLAAACLALTPWSWSQAATQTPALAPHDVTAILPLTGNLAFTGKQEAQALRIIEDLVNKTGGIQHHPLKITITDDQSDPRVAVQLANEVVAKGQALLLGPGFSASCQAVAPVIAKDGPLEYCYSPALQPERGSFVFLSAVASEDVARAFLRYFRDRHWNKIAILSSTDATGQTIDKAYDYLLGRPENRSFTVVDRDHFANGDLTVTAQIQRIKSAHPDALIVISSGAPFATVLHGAFDAGLDVPMASNYSNMNYVQMHEYKAFLPTTLLFGGLRAMSAVDPNPGPIRDKQLAYRAAFRAAGIRPDIGHAIAWDATWIAIDALRHLGVAATADQLRKYIENLHGWVGVNGVYDFAAGDQRGIGLNGLVIDRWDAAKDDFFPVSKAGGAL